MEDVLCEAIAAVRRLSGVDVGELVARQRPGVVVWRQALSGRPHDPRPWISERAGAEPCWREGSSGGAGEWVGLDAAGRPVLSEFRRGPFGGHEPLELWLHADGTSDLLVVNGGARRVVFDDGHVVAVVEVGDGVLAVERWTWSGDLAVRGEIASVGSDWGGSEVYVARVDGDGRFEALSRGYQSAERREMDEDSFLDWLLAQATTVSDDHVVYDVRVHRRESRLSPTHELLRVLPGALERATVAAVAAAGVTRPFVVVVRAGPFDAFRPFGWVGGERFRDRMVALSPEPDAAVDGLVRAEPPDGASFELVEWLDEQAARLCRELTAAIDPRGSLGDGEQQRASDVLAQVGRELAARLNRRSWPDVAQPFLALVHIGEPHAAVDPYVLAAEAIGHEQVVSFRASVQPGGEPAPATPAARHDRAALEQLLVARGLGPHAHRLAHDIAQPALRVLEAEQAASRLGGSGLLPPGGSWPQTDRGRPLTFLAGISLAELPEPGPLPRAGWLLFFADIDLADGDGLIDQANNHPGAPARLLAVRAATEPIAATPPDTLQYVLSERRVRFEPQLTLPDGVDARHSLGLDPAEEDAYDAVAQWLRYGEARSRNDPDHWVLGAATGVQGTWPDAETILLLHLSWDDALGLEYADGGSIQFRIPPRALAVGDWAATRIEAESH